MTIRWRMALAVALQTALLLLLVAAVLYLALNRFLVVGEERRLGNAVAMVDLEHDLEHGDSDTSELNLGREFPEGLEVRVVQGGEVVSQTAKFPTLPTDLPLGYSEASGHRVLTREAMVGGRLAQVQVAGATGGVDEPLRAYLRALMVTLPVMMALAAAAAAITAGRLLRPVAELERSARRIGHSGDLLQPVPGADGRDELGRLAATLQESFRRIGAMRERETEFTRAAAHDLRTPLTALQARIQGTLARPRDGDAYRSTLAELGRDVTRLSRLTDHLLLLARDEDAFAPRRTDLRSLAGEAVDRARARAPSIGIDFRADHDAAVLGDPLLLTHALDNLLDNAVRHGRGSPVTVTLRREAGEAVVSVSDDGPGLDEAAATRLGERFFRPDTARGGDGSGLGLAIVKHVAQLHGGTWQVRTAAGKGFAVDLRLPLA